MSALIARLEAALTPSLARRAALALIVASAAALAIWVLTAQGGVRSDGAPVGSDFVLFHATGVLADQGRLAAAYDGAVLSAAEKLSTPGERLTYLWRYPPTLALLLSPLGAMPYFPAYALWCIAGLVAFGSGLAKLLPGRDGWLLAVGAPATFVCLLHGQTAFLVAACLAWGLALLDRRPLLAGAILSLLVCKPHFALLPPLLLLASGRWRALGGFVGGAGALCALSVAAFGLDPWRAFLTTAPEMRGFLAEGGISWAKVPSAFILAMSLHAPQPAAWALQGVSAIFAVGAAVLVWRGPSGLAMKGAVAVAASLLISPYLVDYDLTVLAVAIALAAGAGALDRPGMKLIALLALATPVLTPDIAKVTGVQLGVLPLLLFAAGLVRACWSEVMEAMICAYWSEAMEAGSATGSGGPVRLMARVVG